MRTPRINWLHLLSGQGLDSLSTCLEDQVIKTSYKQKALWEMMKKSLFTRIVQSNLSELITCESTQFNVAVMILFRAFLRCSLNYKELIQDA